MRRFDKVVVGGFVSVAIVAFAFGLGAIIYAHTVLDSKLVRMNERALTSVELAERGLRVLEMHTGELDALGAPRQSTIATTRRLPAVLEQSANLSGYAAQTLDRSAHTLRSVADATELLLPDDAFERNAEAMSTTARSLEGLIPQLNALREATDSLANDFTRASNGAEELQDELREARVTLKQAQKQLQETRQAFQAANLPAEIRRLVSLQGGMYIALSALLMGMAGIWRRLSQLNGSES